MELAIADLLTKGAVKEVEPQNDQFTSTLFLVQKENGDFRPVINLRALNRFLGKESFKMEGLQIVRSLIQPGDFMMKLDLKDASTNSSLSHEVSEVCVSKQNIRVPVPTIRCIFGSPSLHKNTETSIGCPTFTGDSDCYLHRRHVTPPSIEQCVAGNVCSGGRFPGETGVPGEEREVLNHPLPADNLSRSPAGLHDNDSLPASAKTNEHPGHVLSPPCSKECCSECPVHPYWKNESCLSNRDPDCPTPLQGSSTCTPASSVTVWSQKDSASPLKFSGPGRPELVVLDSSRANGCPIQLPPIDTTIWTDASKTEWGQLIRGYPLGATGVQKRRRSISMSWSYEQQH